MNRESGTTKNLQIYIILILFFLPSLYLGSNFLINHNSPTNATNDVKNTELLDLTKTFTNVDSKQNGISNNQITIPFSGFIKNINQQANSEIEYYYNSQSSGIAFLPSEIIYSKAHNTAFSVTFVGSNTVHPIGVSQTSHVTNYFIGDKSTTNVPSFQEVWYHNLYDKIDLRYYNTEKGLKYEFLVYPGGNPANIKMKYSNNVMVQTTPTTVEITNGQILFSDTNLLAYSTSLHYNNFNYSSDIKTSTTIDLSFKTISDNNIIGFKTGKYDVRKVLVIDPLVVGFTTFIGGSNQDNSRSMAVDTKGNVYITGTTSSSDFPVNTSALDSSQNGAVDAFITKLNTSDNTILYSTYLGGTSNDEGFSIVVDSSDNAYITGYTGSTDFPVSNNAYNKFNNGFSYPYDVFVTKLNSTGNGLVYSTYLGGTGNDYGYALAIDNSGNLFVLGDTLSSDFPVNISSFDSSYNGGRDAFITKFNNTGNGLLYCTFLGGSSNEWSQSLKIDDSGNAYVTGQTFSTDFPVNGSSFDNSFNGGGNDIFVSKLNSTGDGLDYSTYIGGSGAEQANSLFLDSNQNVYLTGFTTSSDFPTVNAFNSSYNVGGTSGYDAFVLKLNNTGNGLDFSSYLGGTGDEAGNSIAVDNLGNIYITGYTYSTNFPVTSKAFQLNNNGGTDAFLSKFNSSGNGLVTSTYLGGSGNDYGYSLFVDAVGSVYITGQTFSSNFPINSSMSGSSYVGGGDAFITKLMFSPDIQITNPTNSTFNTPFINLNYSVTDTNLNLVKIYIDGIANTSTISSGSILNGSTGLADGIHNITIIANNTLGLTTVVQQMFTIDTIAPIITITSPITKIYGTNAIILTYDVSGQSFLDIYIDGKKNSSSIASGLYIAFTTDGIHNITLIASDVAGNYVNQTVSFKVDTTAPTISITSPGNTTYSNGLIDLNYTISDFSIYTTTIYFNGKVNTTIRNSGYQFNLADGTYNITITVTDSVGNSVSKTIEFTIKISTTTPSTDTKTDSFSTSTSSNQSISSSNSGTTTPGFEILFFIITIILLSGFKRRK